MKKELEDKLFEKYPKIFRQKDLSMKESCMCWGIECGDGWYKLIDYICFSLQFNVEHNRFPQVEATQIKEKFGTLRFYYAILPKEDDKYYESHCGQIDGIISFGELLSETICERCGSNQEVSQTKGWISSLCEKCKENKQNV